MLGTQPQPQHTPAPQAHQAPSYSASPAPFRGSASELKADLKRRFSGADDSVVADLAENVVQGQMSQDQALEMLQEMSGAAQGVAQEQSRKDEEYARLLQAQEEHEASRTVPTTNKVGYEGIGGVSRLEQEQRDMELAQQMQSKESAPQQRQQPVARDEWGGAREQQRAHSPTSTFGSYPIHKVAIPSCENRDRNWYFRIEVEGEAGIQYSVYKRYSSFDDFQKRLETQGNAHLRTGPPFPPKSMTSKISSGSSDAHSKRRQALQTWLQNVLEVVCGFSSSSSSSSFQKIKKFYIKPTGQASYLHRAPTCTDRLP